MKNAHDIFKKLYLENGLSDRFGVFGEVLDNCWCYMEKICTVKKNVWFLWFELKYRFSLKSDMSIFFLLSLCYSWLKMLPSAQWVVLEKNRLQWKKNVLKNYGFQKKLLSKVKKVCRPNFMKVHQICKKKVLR